MPMPGSDSHTSARRSKSALLQDGSITGRLWQICEAYAADYVGLVALITVYILSTLFLFDEPFHRMFSLDDRRIQYPHADPEHVPVVWLLIYALVIPFAIISVWSLALFKPHKAHVTMLGFAISMLLTLFVTDVIKNAVGRPRPDLISRCIPEQGTPEHQLISWQRCTQPDHHVLHDGWRSFPSGHSSFSFSGFGYLAFFQMSQFRVFLPRAPLWTSLLAFSPFLAALLIAVSRLEDYRHDVFDVIAGSTLGFLIAYFSWRRYYPALSSKRCSEPYSAAATAAAATDSEDDGDDDDAAAAARGQSTRLGRFSRIRDEEEAMLGANGELTLQQQQQHQHQQQLQHQQQRQGVVERFLPISSASIAAATATTSSSPFRRS